jgi:hypothetical protein
MMKEESWPSLFTTRKVMSPLRSSVTAGFSGKSSCRIVGVLSLDAGDSDGLSLLASCSVSSSSAALRLSSLVEDMLCRDAVVRWVRMEKVEVEVEVVESHREFKTARLR